MPRCQGCRVTYAKPVSSTSAKSRQSSFNNPVDYWSTLALYYLVFPLHSFDAQNLHLTRHSSIIAPELTALGPLQLSGASNAFAE